MTLLADFLLATGAIGAGLYCLILSRRLSRFTDLEKGVGGAVAVLSVQVDELTKVLSEAQRTAASSGAKLEATTAKAESAAARLDQLLSSLHPEEDPAPQPKSSRSVRRSRRSDALAPQEQA